MRILKTLKKEYTEMTKVRSLFSVFMVLVIFCFAKESFSQTDVLTGKQSDAQYVYTARDTSTIPDWVYGSVREGIITNEGTVKMEVFFSDRSGVLDSNTYFGIPSGKTLKFKTTGSKIFRRATADSTFSQILHGDVELSYLNELEQNGNLLVYDEAELEETELVLMTSTKYFLNEEKLIYKNPMKPAEAVFQYNLKITPGKNQHFTSDTFTFLLL